MKNLVEWARPRRRRGLGLGLGMALPFHRRQEALPPPGGAGLFDRPTEQVLRGADSSTLSFSGDQDFWLSFWLFLMAGNKQAILGKLNSNNSLTEWGVWYNFAGAPVLDFQVGAGGAGATLVAGGTAEPLNAWHHIFCVHYSNGLLISMNAGAYVFASWTHGVLNGSNPFCIGGLADEDAHYLHGAVDAVCFGATPPEWGDLGSNCNPIRNSLYNGGDGKAYRDLTAQEKTDWGLRCFFNMDEEAGNYKDSHRKVRLTNINGVTRTTGVV